MSKSYAKLFIVYMLRKFSTKMTNFAKHVQSSLRAGSQINYTNENVSLEKRLFFILLLSLSL